MFKYSMWLFAIVTAFCGCSSQKVVDSNKLSVELLEGLGNHQFFITTDYPIVQKYFNQGLALAYAFNHKESERAFQQALEIDPNCAMCYWGIALVLGPNINTPMDESVMTKAYSAAQKASSYSFWLPEKEQALINALVYRYAEKTTQDRTALDEAYANAMRDSYDTFPNDADIGTLFAEALMNQHPWDYWTNDGNARPWTPEIVATLEAVLEKHPNHIGANHLYIHAVEASNHPERALPSADRLGELAPGAGHLVHMPAHIYIRTGRYEQAIIANQKAVAVDSEYLHHHHTEGIYPIAYVPHNHHFLWAAATNAGRSKEAIAAARSTAANVNVEIMRQPGMSTLEHFYAMPLYALVRFGKWHEILKEPAPAADLRYMNAVWHYARGTAFAARDRISRAIKELVSLSKIAREEKISKMTIWDMNSVPHILEIAENVLEGEIAAKIGNIETAIERLQNAVELEDRLRYNEPSDWYFPVRQALGAVLLDAGKPAQAERVYLADLKKNPENGWSLFGLIKSLEAQRKRRNKVIAEQRFRRAWANADIELRHSRIID